MGEVSITLDEGASENPSHRILSTAGSPSSSIRSPPSQWPATLEHYSKKPRKPPQVQQAASASSADEERNGKTQQISTHKQPMPSGYKSRILKQARRSRRPHRYNKPNSTSPTTWPTPSPRPSKSTAKSHRTMPRASSPPPSHNTPAESRRGIRDGDRRPEKGPGSLRYRRAMVRERQRRSPGEQAVPESCGPRGARGRLSECDFETRNRGQVVAQQQPHALVRERLFPQGRHLPPGGGRSGGYEARSRALQRTG